MSAEGLGTDHGGGVVVRLGSFCSGIAGLDLAVADLFGAVHAWHSEVDPAPASVFARHFPDVPNLGDLTALKWEDVEPVDVLTAGYPCQPFSTAGKRKGVDDERYLWPHIMEAVRVLRPRWVVCENVASHLSLGFGDVLRDLAEAGFDAEWCVLRASDVGAPHRRARLFFVAANADSQGPQGPQPTGRRDVPAWSGRPPAADAEGNEQRERVIGLGERTEPRRSDPQPVDWGRYRPAIDRWARILGRPAPDPLDDRGRLNPAFVEWMMGYPSGWVDGLTRTQALKALGNAVVPQQAALALRVLLPAFTEARGA